MKEGIIVLVFALVASTAALLSPGKNPRIVMMSFQIFR
jgi:hypothetical protein